MNRHIIGYLAVAAAIGIVAATGCRRQSESDPPETPGAAERTGAALDRAADRTAEAATDFTGRVIERTGEGMEMVGEAMERTGADMQTEPDTTH